MANTAVRDYRWYPLMAYFWIMLSKMPWCGPCYIYRKMAIAKCTSAEEASDVIIVMTAFWSTNCFWLCCKIDIGVYCNTKKIMVQSAWISPISDKTDISLNVQKQKHLFQQRKNLVDSPISYYSRIIKKLAFTIVLHVKI